MKKPNLDEMRRALDELKTAAQNFQRAMTRAPSHTHPARGVFSIANAEVNLASAIAEASAVLKKADEADKAAIRKQVSA